MIIIKDESKSTNKNNLCVLQKNSLFSAGFTLIEVLVTVFVLAVGILGVAGMQAVSVRESGNLYYRTQADFLVSDIIDRMRANRREARVGAGSIYDNANTSSTTKSGGCNSSSSCSQTDLADYDIYEWSQSITQTNLPDGVGTLTHIQDSVSASGDIVGSVYTVRVFWDEKRDGQSRSRACNPSNTGNTACVRVTVEI